MLLQAHSFRHWCRSTWIIRSRQNNPEALNLASQSQVLIKKNVPASGTISTPSGVLTALSSPGAEGESGFAVQDLGFEVAGSEIEAAWELSPSTFLSSSGTVCMHACM